VQPRVTGTGDLRQVTDEELRWAEQQVRAATPATAPAAGASPPPGPPVTYSNVFYPGTADESTATPVSVAVGEERAGIDIRAGLVATSRIDGTVVDPSGQPAAGVQLTLLSQTGGVAGSTTDLAFAAAYSLDMIRRGLAADTTARTNAGGAFVISGVSPGKYTLMATTRTAPAAGESAGPAVALWAETDVEVSGHDVSGIALTLAPGMTVSGRFTFEGKAPADQVRASLMVAAAGRGSSAFGSVALTGANPVFSVTGLAPGSYRFNAALPSWTLKSAMLDGRDIVDIPFEITPGGDVTGIVATFTQTAAEVTGVLSDAANRPTADLSIILFSTDRTMWYQGSRRLRAPVRAASNGRFTFTRLPAGEYYLAALTDGAPNDWYNPSFLTGLVTSAIKVTLAEGERKTQDLKISGR
jgi:phenylpyruvate tautomerase PptA (4-oxalocrotonate tautomerase family)